MTEHLVWWLNHKNFFRVFHKIQYVRKSIMAEIEVELGLIQAI